jgi:hypothetical protein
VARFPLRFKGRVGERPKQIKKPEPQVKKEEVDPIEIFGKLE